VILVFATSLADVEYGAVMFALAYHEIFKLILCSGAGAQIIQCTEKNYPNTLETGHCCNGWSVYYWLAHKRPWLRL
jgi:PST family polysaccharide transporter